MSVSSGNGINGIRGPGKQNVTGHNDTMGIIISVHPYHFPGLSVVSRQGMVRQHIARIPGNDHFLSPLERHVFRLFPVIRFQIHNTDIPGSLWMYNMLVRSYKHETSAGTWQLALDLPGRLVDKDRRHPALWLDQPVAGRGHRPFKSDIFHLSDIRSLSACFPGSCIDGTQVTLLPG